jgi:hypothetical protein
MPLMLAITSSARSTSQTPRLCHHSRWYTGATNGIGSTHHRSITPIKLTLSSNLLLAFLSLQIAPTLWWLTLAIPHPQDRPLRRLASVTTLAGALGQQMVSHPPQISHSNQTNSLLDAPAGISISPDRSYALVADLGNTSSARSTSVTTLSPQERLFGSG